jgi:DNA-binding MarR family transcriptional regulator
MAAGVTAVGFVLALVLPDRKLRDTVQAAGTQEHFAVPKHDDRAAEIERVLSVLANRESRRAFYAELLKEIGAQVSPLEAYVLSRIEDGASGPSSELASRLNIDEPRISAALSELERHELIVPEDGWYAATPAGDELIERVVEARRQRLASVLADWSPAEHDDLADVLNRLARDLAAQRPRELAGTPR